LAQPVVAHAGQLQTLNIPTQRCGAVGIPALQCGEDVNVQGVNCHGCGAPGNSARCRLNGVFFKCELVLLSTCNDRCPVAFTARHFVVWSRVIVHCFGSAGFIGAGVSHAEPDTIPVVIVAPLLRVTNELFLWGFTRICRIGNRVFPVLLSVSVVFCRT